MDTLRANRGTCVGMAANMIGVLRRIVAVDDGGKDLLLLNPEILRAQDPFEAEEGCLSLPGTRKVRATAASRCATATRSSRCACARSPGGRRRSCSTRSTTGTACWSEDQSGRLSSSVASSLKRTGASRRCSSRWPRPACGSSRRSRRRPARAVREREGVLVDGLPGLVAEASGLALKFTFFWKRLRSPLRFFYAFGAKVRTSSCPRSRSVGVLSPPSSTKPQTACALPPSSHSTA